MNKQIIFTKKRDINTKFTKINQIISNLHLFVNLIKPAILCMAGQKIAKPRNIRALVSINT